MQDDLDQLLDMLPADLGATLINHPKRAQLVEVRAAWARRKFCCKGSGEGGLGSGTPRQRPRFLPPRGIFPALGARLTPALASAAGCAGPGQAARGQVPGLPC